MCLFPPKPHGSRRGEIGAARAPRELPGRRRTFRWRTAREAKLQVDSSAIRAIDYDRPHRRLAVTFVSGERYEYRGVPGEVHRAFVEADSKGRFFQARIRDRYPFRKLS